MGSESIGQAMTYDGHPSVGIAVFQLPEPMHWTSASGSRRRMRELSRRFPKGVDYDTAYDTTPFIRESVQDVFVTLFEAARW